MKKKLMIFAAIVVALSSSCKKDEIVPDKQEEVKEFKRQDKMISPDAALGRYSMVVYKQ